MTLVVIWSISKNWNKLLECSTIVENLSSSKVEWVDICIDVLKSHVRKEILSIRFIYLYLSSKRHFKEAEVYLLRFQHCMTRAMTLIKMNFVGSLRALSLRKLWNVYLSGGSNWSYPERIGMLPMSLQSTFFFAPDHCLWYFIPISVMRFEWSLTPQTLTPFLDWYYSSVVFNM